MLHKDNIITGWKCLCERTAWLAIDEVTIKLCLVNLHAYTSKFYNTMSYYIILPKCKDSHLFHLNSCKTSAIIHTKQMLIATERHSIGTGVSDISKARQNKPTHTIQCRKSRNSSLQSTSPLAMTMFNCKCKSVNVWINGTHVDWQLLSWPRHHET